MHLIFAKIVLFLLHKLLAFFHPSVKGRRVQISYRAASDPCKHFLARIGEPIVAPSRQHLQAYELPGLEKFLLDEPLLPTHPPLLLRRRSCLCFLLQMNRDRSAKWPPLPLLLLSPHLSMRYVLHLLLLLSTFTATSRPGCTAATDA